MKQNAKARVTRRNFLGACGATALGAAAGASFAAAPAPNGTQAPASGPTVFPREFLWGAASSAHQIEGALQADGRGVSVWDVFAKRPGTTWRGHNGETACDHYQRYREDVALMKQIGLRAYRFSVSWTRILPEGRGTVNEKGLDFYRRLVDELLAAGIAPFLTLFHWDFPLTLYHRGGWLNRDSADWFAEYAAVLSRALSDRVAHWLTINESQDLIGSGHVTGVHAPGDKLSTAAALRAGHHVLLAHGKSVQAIRANSRRTLQVSGAPAGVLAFPDSNSEADIAAARKATFSMTTKETWNSPWWMDPTFLGRYPEDGLALYGEDAPEIRAGDMQTIGERLDFCAINVYAGRRVRLGANGEPETVPPAVGEPMTAFDWPVTPEALYWGPRFYFERYKLPVLVCENGLTCRDWVSLDGAVHDPQRIDFVARYVRELYRAHAEGIPVTGYFHWTFLDNFEWAQGYRHRFGMVFVDYPTQKRILKDSAKWYAQLIASNGRTLLQPWRAS
jgi:beta-glucosidase